MAQFGSDCNPTVLVNNKTMVDRGKIEITLVKLVTGERLLRLSDSGSGLSLEKKLDPKQPIVPQKERLFGVFEAALAQAELNAA